MSKKVIKTVLPLLVLFASMFVAAVPKSAYAEGCSEDIIIEDGEISYADSVDQSTISWDKDTNTLTLNNFKGGSFCALDAINMVLEGDNYVGEGNIFRLNRLTIDGDGSLTLAGRDYHVDTLTLKGGTLNFIRDVNLSTIQAIQTFSISILGGRINSEVAIGTSFFYQKGGELNIDKSKSAFDGKDDGDYYCLFTENSAVFDGGMTNINCGDSPAIVSEYNTMFDAAIPQFCSSIEGNFCWAEDEEGVRLVMPIHGSVLFNSGDINLESDVATVIVPILYDDKDDDAPSFDPETYVDEKGKDFFIMLGDGMSINQAEPVFDYAIDDQKVFVTLTDGTGPTSISGSYYMGFTVSANVLKTAHIVKAAVPVPDTDDEPAETEENPNTVDARIGFLAFGILVAVLAECGIIIDLYRRLFGIKEQITEAEGIEEKTEDCDGKA